MSWPVVIWYAEPSIPPFGLDRRRFREMKSETLIQVRRQAPEFQQFLLESCQGNDVRCQLACRLDKCQADSLEGLQEQFRTWSFGLSARLARVQAFQRLLVLLQLLPYRPLQHTQQPQPQAQ